MLIVVVAWLYVVILMSLTEATVLAGISTFFFYGGLPVGILVWFFGTGRRRQRRQLASETDETEDADEAEAADAADATDNAPGISPDHARSAPPSGRTDPRGDSSRSDRTD